MTERAAVTGARASIAAALILSCAVGKGEATQDRRPVTKETAVASSAAIRLKDPGRPPLWLRATSLTSSTVRLAWRTPAGARHTRVYLGAEPPSQPGGPLGAEVERAKLPGAKARFTLKHLAAATDLFLRIEVKMPKGALRQALHVRLPGGPRARLDTPLREVHGYGPRVLQLVFANPGTRFDPKDGRLGGDRGAEWQGGTWTVARRDGRAVPVKAVYRHSVPVGQPSYPVAFNRFGNDRIVDVDHRIFLVLAEPLGSAEVLTVRHRGAAATSLQAVIPFSDRYLVTPLLQVNQVGYNPRAKVRWAYLSGWMGDGGPAGLGGIGTKAEVLVEPSDALRPRRVVGGPLPISLRSKHDPEAGAEVRQIDLGRVPSAEGVRYRIRIPGVGVSWPTAVSEQAAFRAWYVVTRGLYHNRWCGDLGRRYTRWSRPADHCQVFAAKGRSYRQGMFPRNQARKRRLPLRGGHHDAGDFDIRPFHVLAGQALLRAYEMAPKRFADGQLNLPESGNGIPDLLDEGLWSIAAWEQLQHADGSVSAGVESSRHPPGIYFADKDQLSYWTYDAEPWHTAYVAALFAQASFLVRPFDKKRATSLEAAARKAYAWAAGRGAPDSYRLYAAGELYRLTGKKRYASDYEKAWKALDKYGRGAFERLVTAARIYPGSFVAKAPPVMADFAVAYAASAKPDRAIYNTTLRELDRWAQGAARGVLDSARAHRNGRDPRVRDWGAMTSTGRHMDPIFQRLQLGGLPSGASQTYLDALSLSADYVLGCNPAGVSFITGLGSRFPREPLHLDSLAFIKKEGLGPVPGIPVYGPVNGYPGAHYYRPQGAAFYPSFNRQPPGWRFADTRASVKMNEFSVWEMQAPAALLFSALLGPRRPPAPRRSTRKRP